MRKFKFFWQRLTRGWDDSETWNLDVALAKWIIPRLRRFQTVHSGVPSGSMSDAEWSTMIYKMIVAFELIEGQFDDSNALWYDDPELKEGLDLFREHILNLWW